MELQQRFERAAMVRDRYPEFVEFAVDAMWFLGFHMTWMQLDIARHMQHGPVSALIEAQRGEAKSTIACLYGVWCLVQDPKCRVVIVSAGTDKAEENGKLMHGLIHNWDVLAHLIPDRNAGDRTSTVEFDVHYALKGVEKSASVNCLGITSSLQGYRADLLVADDVESNRNGLTNTERAKLAALTREFSAICTHGRILYLGTPQSQQSVYNGLPARGYTPCIWPGRFPTEEQEVLYGEYLAPSIVQRMATLGPQCRTGGGLDGKQGWPTDPHRFDEETLCTKEIDWGPEGFQLQYMLNTRLADAERQQLKPKDLIVPDMDYKQVPETLGWAVDKHKQWDMGPDYPIVGAELFSPAFTSQAFTPLSQLTMTIDPAGSGGDEVAFAIGGVAGPYIHVIAWGGYKGGLNDDNLAKLAELVREYGVKSVVVERNMGAGTATRVVSGYFLNEGGLRGLCGVSDMNSTGQKERRIIDLLRPIMAKHRLVMHKSAVDMDFELLKQYSRERRNDYCGMYQLSTITTDRQSLKKDDRIDVLEQLCRVLSTSLEIDEEKASEKRKHAVAMEFINNPMGYTKTVLGQLGRGKSKGPKAMRKRMK